MSDVYPTVDSRTAAGVNSQLERGGGTSCNSFNFEMYDHARNVCVCISARRARDCIVYKG